MKEKTRDKIIQAALSSFANRGYEGTGLAQIASSVGIRKPSLYNHFSGKAELFLSVAKKATDEMLEVMVKSSETHAKHHIEKRLYFVLWDSTTFIIQKHEGVIYRSLLLFPPEELEEELRIIVQYGDESIDQLLRMFFEQAKNEQVITDLHFSAFRFSFYCLLDGLVTESVIYGEKEREERFKGAWTVFWRGVSN